MIKYECKKCGNKKELRKTTLVIRNGKAVGKEAYCIKCDLYMTSKPNEGMPQLIRTEPTLRKK
jgi:hypothetical protein